MTPADIAVAALAEVGVRARVGDAGDSIFVSSDTSPALLLRATNIARQAKGRQPFDTEAELLAWFLDEGADRAYIAAYAHTWGVELP